MIHGVVAEFDDPAGYGWVTSDAHPDQRWFFHCSSIADGSRTIDVGTNVAFVSAAGHMGHLEAFSIAPR